MEFQEQVFRAFLWKALKFNPRSRRKTKGGRRRGEGEKNYYQRYRPTCIRKTADGSIPRDKAEDTCREQIKDELKKEEIGFNNSNKRNLSFTNSMSNIITDACDIY